MRRKVNNSEIHETKKYYEVPSEKVQEWSDTIADLTKQNQQFKAERDKFEQMLNEECERGYQMEGKYRGMKAERDSLITDLDVLRNKVKTSVKREQPMDFIKRISKECNDEN